MKNVRHGLRATCTDKCVLVLNGTPHDCILENISISGALVQQDGHELGIHPGTRCGLHLCNDPRVCPGEYACQVTRITETQIGLKFINMH